MHKNIIQFENKKTVTTNKLINNNQKEKPNTNLKELELELLIIEQNIQDYLERVEFYIEEPNLEYLSSLQEKRLVLKKQLLLAKPNLNDLVNKINKLEQTVLNLTTTSKKNSLMGNVKSIDSKQVGEINSKINIISTQLLSVQATLKKERSARTKLINYLSKEDTCLYRTIYELSKEKTVSSTDNIKHQVLDWIDQQVTKNPNWGLKQIDNNSKINESTNNEELTNA